MNCPVCNYNDIGDLSTTCPRCRADLSAFVALENAEQDYVEVAKKRVDLEGRLLEQKKSHEQEVAGLHKRINRLWLLLLLLPLLHLICYKAGYGNSQNNHPSQLKPELPNHISHD